MKAFKLPDIIARGRDQVEIFDDFHWLVTAHLWTTLAADGGVSLAQTDAANGIITFGTSTTDNNEVMVRSTNEVFKFAADAGFIFEARLQYAEAATSAANVCVGLGDAAGANVLLDDGGGLGTFGSFAGIYKIDGGTKWIAACKCNSAHASAPVASPTTSIQTAGSSSFFSLRILGSPVDGTSYEITYFLDGAPLTDSTGRPIKHTLPYASATEMRLIAAYLKCGSTTAEALLLDYCAFASVRV